MRKVYLYILFLVLLCFLIPILFTRRENIREVISLEEKKPEEITYDYGKYNKIKLMHSSTGEIEELELDTYLLGVVSGEMPAYFEDEALKAQSIVARTYTIYKIYKRHSIR